ncbi:hypothetical protein [Actinoplanes sp. GCM10030250]|uniref:hypothetical protein n=1 Tax=Actinoplanes sp. GCM10030250 TaxID=3273376 RepID=UPI00361D6C41
MNSGPGSSIPYFKMGGVRLYLPDEEFGRRLGGSTAELSAYIQTLARVGEQYFGHLGRDFGSLGVLVAVGIKPERQVKLWCEVVGGQIPDDVWSSFVELLDGAGVNVRPQVSAPVAFAIEAILGNGPASFPDAPTAWIAAVQDHDQGVSVPEGIFEIVFP